MNRADLATSLERYAPRDAAETESLARIRALLAAPEDPFARANSAGHVTASAVVARPDGSAFLLVFHRKLQRWLQPGGHTEESDASPFDTAVREAREETGIARFDAPLGRELLDLDVHAIPPHRNDPAHSHFDFRYLLTTEAPIDREAAEDPDRPMAWRSFEEAVADGVDASLRRALEKAQRALAAHLPSPETPPAGKRRGRGTVRDPSLLRSSG